MYWYPFFDQFNGGIFNLNSSICVLDFLLIMLISLPGNPVQNQMAEQMAQQMAQNPDLLRQTMENPYVRVRKACKTYLIYCRNPMHQYLIHHSPFNTWISMSYGSQTFILTYLVRAHIFLSWTNRQKVRRGEVKLWMATFYSTVS